ncbi:hypothetical protein, partial [uncultured Endozoicomonas sp.]|uniref:hypothetical protein n=1 Tax=uncultured Endozoicomonas sp. TaxID=432652 RepID=UPI00261F4213
HLVDLSIGCFHRLIQAIVFKSLFLLAMNPHQLTLAFSLEIVRGRGAHSTRLTAKVNNSYKTVVFNKTADYAKYRKRCIW